MAVKGDVRFLDVDGGPRLVGVLGAEFFEELQSFFDEGFGDGEALFVEDGGEVNVPVFAVAFEDASAVGEFFREGGVEAAEAAFGPEVGGIDDDADSRRILTRWRPVCGAASIALSRRA